MRNFVFAVAAGLGVLSSGLAVTSVAEAQTAPAVTLLTVDAYAALPIGHSLEVTGLALGATAPTTFELTMNSERIEGVCERAIIQVINRPGRFRLELRGLFRSEGQTVQASACRLVRATP